MENTLFDQATHKPDFQSIFGLAYKRAYSYASDLIPAPGLINDYVDMEGHPGRAVIILAENNKELMQWVLANVPGARKLYKGPVSISCPWQLGSSFERQTVYCMQFALVLAEFGIRTKIEVSTQFDASSPEVLPVKSKVVGRLRPIY